MNAQSLAELRQTRPMAIDPSAWSAIAATAANSVAATADNRRRTHTQRVGENTVAVLPLTGLIGYRSALVNWIGGTNLDHWVPELRALDNSEGVAAVLIDACSPGGFVDYVPEAAAAVRATTKPTVLLMNVMAASAAYWLASQCDAILALRSSEGGSIGVRSGHVSYADANARAGVEVSLIASSPQKVELSPDLKLSEEARARMQKGVDDVYVDFKADVQRGRGVAARPEYARLLSSREMAAAGLIDGIVSDPGEAAVFAARLGSLPAGRRAAFAREMDLARAENIPAADIARAALARVCRDGSYQSPAQKQHAERERELRRLGV